MGDILDFLVYKPFSWLLVQLYEITHSYALAIILFAFITKIVLLYFSARGKHAMMRQQRLQPKMQALQKQYAGDKEKLNAETMKLYQTENVSPMGGCLWMLLPLPVLFMLFAVIRQPLTYLMNFPGTAQEATDFAADILTKNGIAFPAMTGITDPYPQLKLAQVVHENFAVLQEAAGGVLRNIDFSLFGLNLTLMPTLPWDGFSWLFLIPIISAGTSYFQVYVSNKLSKMPQTSQTKYMTLLSPVMALWFGFIMPAAMSVYWIANSVFGMLQDVYLTKKYTKVIEKEEARKAEMEERRKAAEAKQREEDRLLRAEKMANKHKNAKKYKMSKHPKK